MFCRRCGNKLNDGDLFCSKCGSKVENDIEEVVFPEPVVVEETTPVVEETVIDVEEETTPVVEEATNEVKEPRGPWKVFAIIGYVYGIVSLVSILIPFYSFAMAIDGIIFSALGVRSTVYNKKAKKGLTMNIISCVVNYIWSIIFYVILLFLLTY